MTPIPICLLGLMAVVAPPHTDGGLKTYVHKLNLDTAKAYESKDAAFFDRLYSPSFESKDEHGVLMKRKESLFMVRFQLNTLKVLDCKVVTQAIKLEKARGTVVTQAVMLGLTPARHGQPGQKVKISRRWSDVFVRDGKSWDLISRTELTAPVIAAVPLTPAKPAKK